MTDKEPLKPCPFCGSEAELGYMQHVGWHVSCPNCPCEIWKIPTEEFSEEFPKEEAIAAWNTRKPELVPISKEELKRVLSLAQQYRTGNNDEEANDYLAGLIKARFGVSAKNELDVEEIERVLHVAYFKSKKLLSSYDAGMLKTYAQAIRDNFSAPKPDQKLRVALEKARTHIIQFMCEKGQDPKEGWRNTALDNVEQALKETE